ncbi:MAG: two-component regulator propeller domain-containing protein [Dysgonamonadaceae bacterium]|nr:two-component regulator propeller domain-containing protein [Dysgonamonadaceae bacterium]
MKTSFILVTTFFSFSCSIVMMQAQDLTMPAYKHYGIREGLPQAQITTLFQDSRGYIWAGTNNGAARFNGNNFYSFTNENNFPFSYVNSFTEDGQGRVWVFCRHGIACINGDSIAPFPQTGHILGKMSPGNADTLWFIATRKEDDHRRIGYFINQTYHFTDFSDENQVNKDVFYLEYDHKHKRLLFSTHYTIYQYKNNRITELYRPVLEKDFKLHRFYIQDGKLIIGAYSDQKKEMLIYDADSGKLLFDISSGDPSKTFTVDHQGFSFFNAGEDYYVENGEIHHFNIPEHFIMTMLKDKDNTYWLGTERGLLRMFSDSFVNFNSTLLPEIWSVTEHPKGQYWFASFSFGLKTWKNGKLKTVLFNGKEIKGHYFHPVVGNNGAIYFPLGDGILKRSPNGIMKLLTYTWKNNVPICFYTYYDRQRNCLLGGFRGNVAVWDDQDNLIREIGRASGFNLSGFVHCIAQDSARNYWFGSPDIYHYDWDANKLKRYASTNDIQNCFDISTDYGGTTWFGTQKGLLYYNKQTDSLVQVNSPELQDWVLMVLPLDEERLLLSQPDGLYVLNLRKFQHNGEIDLSIYNEANGYLGGEPDQAGANKDSEGNIWITGSDMLSRLNPQNLPKADVLKIKPVFVRCNNIPVLYDQKEIKLPRNQNSATVVLDVVALNRPRAVEYSYRTSEENPWSVPQTENYITLTDLPHGKTTLYVYAMFQGLNRSTTANKQLLIIHVSKAFYNQSWFIPLMIFLLLMTVVLLMLIQSKTYLKLQKALIQAKVAEVETIQLQMNPHFIYNVLANIQSRIRNLQIEDAESALLKLSYLMRRFLHSFTETSSKDPGNMSNIRQNMTSLDEELSLLQEFIDFQQMLYPDTFVYLLSIDDKVNVSDVKIPPMLMQPFIENSISHGLIPKKSIGLLHIDIGKESETEKIIIRIMDDGIGMKKAQQMQLQSTLLYPPRGRKLTMQRIQLLKELGFHVDVHTETSSTGTTVTLVL